MTSNINLTNHLQVGTAQQVTQTTSTSSTQTQPVKDSTSSAGGSGQTSSASVDAGNPKLITSDMTPAEIAAMIETICNKARQQRRISQESKSGVEYKSSYEQKEMTFEKTVVVKDKNETKEVPVTLTALIGESKIRAELAQELSSAILDPVEKQLKKKHTPQTLVQMQAFINNVTQNAMVSIVVPSLALLGPVDASGSIKSVRSLFRDDDAAVKTAVATQFTKNAMELVSTGQIAQFASELLPNDPDAAKQIESMIGANLIQVGIEMTGQAMDLAGLNKVLIEQARVFRDEMAIVKSDPFKVIKHVLDEWIKQSKFTAQQEREYRGAAEKALSLSHEAKTHAEFIASIEASLLTQFNGNAELAHDFTARLAESAFAVVTEGRTLYAPSKNLAALNADTALQSVAMSVSKAFANSIEQNEAASKAKALTEEVLAGIQAGQYKTEQQVRDAIAAGLKQSLQGLELNPEQQATDDQIGIVADHAAAALDLGLPADPADPLTNRESDALIPPWAFAETLRTDYQNSLHVSPKSDLGQDIDSVAGLSTQGNNPIAQLNNYYERGDSEIKSYLNVPSADAAKVALLETTDAAAVVKNLGTLYAHPPENGHKQTFI